MPPSDPGDGPHAGRHEPTPDPPPLPDDTPPVWGPPHDDQAPPAWGAPHPDDVPPEWGAPHPPAPEPLGGMLSPWTILLQSRGALGGLVIVGAVNPRFLIPLVVMLSLSVAASAVRWARFSWRVETDALVIEQGMWSRQRRVIPLERVQSVDTVRGVLHRLVGVVQVKIEAVGGGATEGQLEALDPATAERLRTAVLAGRARAKGEPGTPDDVPGPDSVPGPASAEDKAPPADEVLVRMSRRRLVQSGLTAVNGALPAAIVGVSWQVLEARFGFQELLEVALERIPGLPGPTAAVLLTAVLIILVLALFVIGQVVAYWDFTVRRGDDRLHVSRGLLEQRRSTIPLGRLQVVRVEENPVRQVLGWALARADVAGRAGESGGGSDVLTPFARQPEAMALGCDVLGLDDPTGLELQPAPTRALTKRVLRATVLPLVAGAVLAVTLGPVWGWVAALALPFALLGFAAYRALGWARHGDGALVVRSGLLVRRTVIVPRARLQSASLSQTMIQRWRRLANVDLDVARPPGSWIGPRAIDLDVDVARELVADILGDLVRPVAPRRQRTSPVGS